MGDKSNGSVRRGIIRISPEFVLQNVRGLKVVEHHPVQIVCDCDLFDEWMGGPIPRYHVSLENTGIEGQRSVVGARKI